MVLIISRTFQNNNLFDEQLIISDKVVLIDDFHIEYENKVIEFDYLLCDDLNLITGFEKTHILMDDEPVLNFFGQTSLEHIYIGDLETSIDHLINGE